MARYRPDLSDRDATPEAFWLRRREFLALGAAGAVGARDVAKRRFITVGFAAFLLLVPLAVTSTKGRVRHLGFTRWKRLHRLAYAAALLGVVHFVWRVKVDLRKPIAFAAALALLLGARGVALALRRRQRRS